mgnify:CR=1 FL=1
MSINLSRYFKDGTTVIIGPNEWSRYKKKLNSSALIIITSKSCKKYVSDIDSEKILEVKEEPTFKSVDKLFEEIYPVYKKLLTNNKEITLIALGGGSVIDTSKILSLMLSNNIKTSFDALVKSDPPRLIEKIKIICVPTTAGTGAETTQFSTIWNMEKGLKYSIISTKLNRIIILDPKLSLDLPEKVTISTGTDSLCQLLESTWSKKADQESIDASTLGIQYLTDNFSNVISNPKNIDFRQGMLIASFLSGISISISNTTLCHSISYPLTSFINIPHGIACGFTLIEVIKLNSTKEEKFIKNTLKAAGIFDVENLINKISQIFKDINFKKIIYPFLEDIEKNIDKFLPLTINSRASNNPVDVSLVDIEKIIKNSLNYFK